MDQVVPGRYSKHSVREERRAERLPLTPQERIEVPGKYVAQWGGTRSAKIEFYSNLDALKTRLVQLWNDHHGEAQGRVATYSDVVLYWQTRMK